MSGATTSFTASSVKLMTLLDHAAEGRLQLPDFQRGWVWDEERIRSLIASISRGFPVGAVMTLRAGGGIGFKPRPLEGAEPTDSDRLESLLLDGQQRLTSLFQVLHTNRVVDTITPKRLRVKRWFYLDIEKCLDASVDRDDAVLIVPEGKVVTRDFGRSVLLDVSSVEREIERGMFPVQSILAWNEWQRAFIDHYTGHPEFGERFSRLNEFYDSVVKNFLEYLVPVIELSASTTKEAVCVVFEKVNTGGKPLDAFELVTAMYAADGYELRKDWYGGGGQEGRLARFKRELKLPSANEGVLAGVGNTDFLQAISLLHTRDEREKSVAAGRPAKELPKVSATRQSLLDLPLFAYLKYQDEVERGFCTAARFLMNLGVYRVKDLPYQSQIVPLAAIFAALGDEAETPAALERLKRWYWNGVFGELYGSTTETRIARDFIEVPRWIRGGDEPSTVKEATVRADRLQTMRMRLSAAYKGVNALLMHRGAQDFRTGQTFSNTVFFDENVDIHHIFPRKWCEANGCTDKVFDSIINKTPLSARTNRIIGGDAPSGYLGAIQRDNAELADRELDDRLRSHLIDPELLRGDRIEEFMAARQAALVELISNAIGKKLVAEEEEGEALEGAEDEEE